MDKNKVLNMKDPPNSTADVLTNAAIMAGLNFFTTLAAMGATGLLADLKTGLLGAGISAGLSFFLSLAIQRGLVTRPEEAPPSG